MKALLIAAGLRVLYRKGIRATATQVPMTEALEELEDTHGIKVGMGSIFGRSRIWSNVGEFQIDLLRAAIEDRTGGGPNDQSLALIEQLPDMRSEPYEQRVSTLIELCRIAGSINGYVADEPKTRSWPLWVAIWTTAMADVEVGDQLVPALREEQQATLDSFSAVFEIMLSRLGLRIRPPYTMANMSTLAAAITDGIALRSTIAPDLVGSTSTPRSDHEWNLLGVGLMAIALELLEDDLPNPDDAATTAG